MKNHFVYFCKRYKLYKRRNLTPNNFANFFYEWLDERSKMYVKSSHIDKDLPDPTMFVN